LENRIESLAAHVAKCDKIVAEPTTAYLLVLANLLELFLVDDVSR
jgi:hypothetical protein